MAAVGTSLLRRAHATATAAQGVLPRRKLNLVFLGAPGSGKGTYAALAVPAFGLTAISTGDFVREELKSNSDLGQRMRAAYAAGGLVDDEMVNEVLFKRLPPDAAQRGGFIFDGYPRKVSQARFLDQRIPIDAAVEFILNEEVIMAKIAGRRVCPSCGNNYNVAHVKLAGMDMPPMLPKREGLCDGCGAKLIQRDDDREEVARARLKVAGEIAGPIREYYKEQGKLRPFVITASTAAMAPVFLKILEGIRMEARL
eukprot:tig00020904_g15222.t1